MPKLSLIIATYNDAIGLARCLDSIEQQTVRADCEVLVLDNASSDGTVELLKDRSDRLDYWESERDRGIYHAWNKAISRASGDYVAFVGADDYYASPTALQQLLELTAGQPDLVSGRNAYYSPEGKFLRNWGYAWDWQRMRESMILSHPSLLMRRSLFDRIGLFDERFRICGDYDWLLRLPPDLKAVHTNQVILCLNMGGVSNTQVGRVFAETFRAQRRQHDLGLWRSGAYWLLNWLKYGRRKLIGLA
ncbi:glycosyltransferase family 2 protein [Synechococcus elongatus IITB4]|uniref:glycosyltransferase family 2 protein n=1 Tax=Synechococcus elongatus TaxID=32046 RepID=UPI0030CADDE5